ncbi:uncharacterized protein PHALS_06007 [Plasmopara halstedii]|uniref:Uncharacterized protein n=1 Tax=Plasmopara halstedii TaxID=4781 RepID=A0A0P1ACL6_PLAHL|nr:uncharacterized protein PHALS_06007 [Plasmopara halstedii]CEG37962.1 hypothetical protein PHALS_06007 [Plasmopara halstedii]|eukprot:XP_024574331.1 hypothetical protein PHALS_06007 [Plasmopara halstedii]
MDQNEQEERKINAFKNMVMEIKCIGVPFGFDQYGGNLQDPMVFEKWPLVQSYGLDGRDSRDKGFLTMNHQVVNISQEMMQVMAHLDTFSAKRLVKESQPFLAHHFDAFLQKLDHAESPDVRNAKSECELGENLLTSYEFGTMQYRARGLQIAPNRGSRVLFGVRTNALTEVSSSEAFLANSGARSDVPATHMVVQAEDPLTGVRFARTYFFSTGKVCKQIFDDDSLVYSQQQLSENVPKSAADTKTMIDMYALLFYGFKKGVAQLIECMAGNMASIDQCLKLACAEAIQKMIQVDRAESQMLGSQKFPVSFFNDQLHFIVEAMDARGQRIDYLTKDWCLLYCSMTLNNIPSDADSDYSLGSLSIGDTYLFRGRETCETLATQQVLNVTKSFAVFRSWVQSGEEANAIDNFLRSLQSEFILQNRSLCLGKELTLSSDEELGKSPIMSSKAILLFNSKLLPIVRGSWRTYTGGFVFFCPNFNPIIVSIEQNVEWFSILPSSYDELVLLKIVLKIDKDSHLTPLSNVMPVHLESDEIYIPLQSSSRFQVEVFKALESWKATAAALNTLVNQASELLKNQQVGLQREQNGIHAEIPSQVKATCEMLVSKQSFVGQDARTIDKLFPQDFIPNEPDEFSTVSLPISKNPSRLDVPVTIMIGIPGSGVEALGKLVCSISSSSFTWIPINIDLRNLEPEKQQKMENNGLFILSGEISRALDRINESAQSLHLPPRILISITGYIDPIMVAIAVRRGAHNAPLSSTIGAIITCLSAVNVNVPDPLDAQAPLPKVFDQMTAGFVTHLVVTNSSYVSEVVLQRLRSRMDQVNPFTDVIVLSHDVFEGPITPLLSVDRFESVEHKQYRGFHFQDWDSSVLSDDISSMYTRYVAELEPTQSPVSFRFEIGTGLDRYRFLQSVVKTLTPYATLAKSLDRIYPIDKNNMKGIRIAQTIAINKARQDIQKTSSSSSISCSDVVSLDGRSQSCWCVEGQVVFKDEPDRVYEYLSTGTLARIWVGLSHDKNTKNVFSTEVKITGQGLNAQKLHQLLLSCYDHADSLSNHPRSKASISHEEKCEIQRQHAADPLPEGYLFDGTNYVDFFGSRYEFHPCIARFIDEYIAAVNDDKKVTKVKASAKLGFQCFVKQLV